MQAFQRAAAVFCMACIGAELVSFFAGQSWAGRCIKAAAGLYILAVLLAQLPRLPGKVLTAFQGAQLRRPRPLHSRMHWKQRS